MHISGGLWGSAAPASGMRGAISYYGSGHPVSFPVVRREYPWGFFIFQTTQTDEITLMISTTTTVVFFTEPTGK